MTVPTVLIVDDSEAFCDELAAALRAAGLEVALALDGEEVFRKVNAYDPAAMLVDVYMPKIDGAEVCRLIKGHPRWKKIHLVVMSARMSDSDAAAYRRMGADDVLAKPFDLATEASKLAKALARGR